MANVIEILLRTKDETKAGFNSVRSGLGGIKALIGGFAGALALRAVIGEMEGAEKAAFNLDQAFGATGKTAGVTRKALDDLATTLQNTTTVSDDLVKEGEAILLTFTKVRGEAFERTIKVANDLSARMGGDLTDAIRKVGIALQDPERGLRGLRTAGIVFSDSQKTVIKNLVDTGQQAKAQEIILEALEKRYKGTAEAARNTLSGSLKGLKNAFGDLFEGSGDNSNAVKSINELSKVLQDPDLKNGINTLIAGMAKIASIGISAAGGIGHFFQTVREYLDGGASATDATITKIKELQVAIEQLSKGSGGYELEQKIKQLAALQSQLDQQTGRSATGGKRGKYIAPIDGDKEFISSVKEVTVYAKKVSEDVPAFLQAMNDATKTETEKAGQEFEEFKAQLSALVDEQIITPEEAAKRRAEYLDAVLPEFDLNEIRSRYKVVKQEMTELDEFTKGVWQNVGRSIQSSLSDAIYNAKFDLKSLVDIARRAFADILSAIITSGIKKAIVAQFSGASGGTGGATGWGGILLGAAALFGFSAAGGRSSKPRWVGEEGPELLTEPGQITNQRSLNAMGGMGGASVTFSPQFQYTVTEREDPAKTKSDMARYTQTVVAQSFAEFTRLLKRSGVEVRA
jgi:hypothetical protein